MKILKKMEKDKKDIKLTLKIKVKNKKIVMNNVVK